MKKHEIILGCDYAVSVGPLQIVDLGTDLLGQRYAGQSILHDVNVTNRVLHGIRARAEAFEGNRVQVIFVAYHIRSEERVEDNLDGTETHWRGIVMEGGLACRHEREYEAIITLGQVKMEWIDALVETEVRMMDMTLKYHPERIFERAND
jgi:hypothetical protein